MYSKANLEWYLLSLFLSSVRLNKIKCMHFTHKLDLSVCVYVCVWSHLPWRACCESNLIHIISPVCILCSSYIVKGYWVYEDHKILILWIIPIKGEFSYFFLYYSLFGKNIEGSRKGRVGMGDATMLLNLYHGLGEFYSLYMNK